MIKKQTVDLMKNKRGLVFSTPAHGRMLFSVRVSVEMVKHYVVSLTSLLLREPTGTAWGGFISLILITLITRY